MDIGETIRKIISNPAGFLLKNLGVKQTIFKNTFWLAVAQGITRFLKLILIIYVARILGATEYGKFTFALAFVSLFAIFSDLGVSSITTREIAREEEKEKEFPFVLSLKTFLGIGTLIAILIGSFFITPDPVIRGVIWILAVYILVNSFASTIFSFFQGRQKMEYQAWAQIIQALIVTGAGFIVLFNFPSVKNLSFSYLFAALGALVFILLIFHFKVSPIRFGFNKAIWKNYLLMSWPLALGGMMGSICSNTDSTMMGYWGQMTQTGWYNAAQRIVGVALIPTGLIGISFFPALSNFFGKSKERFQRAWNYYMKAMIFTAVPLAIGGIVLAPKIIDLVYDPSYLPAVLAFQILIITGGISILAGPLSQALVVSNEQKKAFWIVLIGAVVNVALNFILIPRYSLYGAALTTMVSGILMLYLFFRFTAKYTKIKPINLSLFLTLLTSIFSALLMYLLISQPAIYNLHVAFSISIGILSYSLSFIILKNIIRYPIWQKE